MRSQKRGVHGGSPDRESLNALASDPELLNGASPPRFPSSLIALERKYTEAVKSGQADRVSAARAAFSDSLKALGEKDSLELLVLEERPGSSEKETLQARVVVLKTRLQLLDRSGTGDPTAAAEDPTAPMPAGQIGTTDRGGGSGRLVRSVRPTIAGQARGEQAVSGDAAGPRHRNDIQGLRAVAVLLVALSHAGVSFLKGGYVGVDVFFVLSGFLITGLLMSEARVRRYVSLGSFYFRRARRILPAAILTIIVTDVAAYHLLNFVRAKQYLQDSIPSAFFAANIHFASQGTNYFAQGQPPSPFQHFWSLAVEEQFYVVWPALFIILLGLALRRYAPRPNVISDPAVRRVLIFVVAIAAASLVWSIHYTASQPAAAYFSTPARAWELALGAALALVAPRLTELPTGWRTVMGWGGLTCIAIAAVGFTGSTQFPGYAALLPVAGGALLIAAGSATLAGPRSASRMLGVLPLRYVGDRSYAFYLWHWPVLVIAAQHAGHSLSVGTNLLLLLGAFALSILSYKLFEKPIRYAEWTRKPEALLPLVGSLLAVVVISTTWVSSINARESRQRLVAAHTPAALVAPRPVAPSPHSPTKRVAADSAVSQVLPAVIDAVNGLSRRTFSNSLDPPAGQLLADLPQLPGGCLAFNAATKSTICRLGSPASTRTIVVIGDSHAEMWMPAILSFARQDGWAVVPIMKSACSPAEWTTGTGDCQTWFRWAIRTAGALHPRVSLIAGLSTYGTLSQSSFVRSLTNGFNAAAGAMKKRANRVVIVGDAPVRQRQPVDCLLAPHASSASCTDTLTQTEQGITSLVAQIATSDGVGFIDTTGWFCYRAQCPLVVGKIITYRDTNHVSQTYATALGGAFRAAFDQVVSPG